MVAVGFLCRIDVVAQKSRIGFRLLRAAFAAGGLLCWVVLTRVVVLHTAPGLGTWIVENVMDARLLLMKASGSFSSGPAGGQELDGLVTGLQRVCSVEHAIGKQLHRSSNVS